MIKLPRGLLLSADDAVAGGYSWSSWAESESDVAHHTFIISYSLRLWYVSSWDGGGRANYYLFLPQYLLTQICY